MDEADEFESSLEHELRSLAQSVHGSRPRAAQAAYRAGYPPRPRRRFGRPAGRGLAAGVATAVALCAGAIGVAAATGSADPASWGHALVRAVEGCHQPECSPVPTPVAHTPGPSDGAGAAATPEPGAATGQGIQPHRTPTPTATPESNNSDHGNQGSGESQNSGNSASASGHTRKVLATPSSSPGG